MNTKHAWIPSDNIQSAKNSKVRVVKARMVDANCGLWWLLHRVHVDNGRQLGVHGGEHQLDEEDGQEDEAEREENASVT